MGSCISVVSSGARLGRARARARAWIARCLLHHTCSCTTGSSSCRTGRGQMHNAGSLSTMLPWLIDDVEEIDAVFGGDAFPYGIEANRATPRRWSPTWSSSTSSPGRFRFLGFVRAACGRERNVTPLPRMRRSLAALVLSHPACCSAASESQARAPLRGPRRREPVARRLL